MYISVMTDDDDDDKDESDSCKKLNKASNVHTYGTRANKTEETQLKYDTRQRPSFFT